MTKKPQLTAVTAFLHGVNFKLMGFGCSSCKSCKCCKMIRCLIINHSLNQPNQLNQPTLPIIRKPGIQGHAAIYKYGGACNVICLIGCKPGGKFANIIRFADAVIGYQG
jgi:hypothetical protein